MRRFFLIVLLASSPAFTQSARFPQFVPSTVDLPFASNNAETQLTSTITSNSRTFTVLDPDKFKVPGYVTIYGPAPEYTNREIVEICQKQGNTLTTCPNGRGIDPVMPPAYHKYGDTVAALVNAEYINHLSSEVIAQATALGAGLSNVIKTGQAAGGDLNGLFPNPTVRTVNGGRPLPVGDVVGTTDTQSLFNKSVSGVFYGPLHGNADTASTAVQLSGDPQDCTTGQYSYAIAPNANLTCKQIDWSELSGRPTSMPPSGPAGGDFSGTYPNPAVAAVGGKTASAIAAAVSAVEAATDLSTNNALVKRSSGGNISAVSFTGSLIGNSNTASALASDPAACSTNLWVADITAAGVLTCTQPGFANLSGTIAAAQLPDVVIAQTATGSASAVPVISIDAKGRVTAMTTAAIDPQAYRQIVNAADANLTKRTNLKFGVGLDAVDDGSSATVVALKNTTVAAGTYGTATKSAQITVDAQGRVTSVSELAIPGTDGAGYVTIYNTGVALTQRSYLNVTDGLVAVDDAGNLRTKIGLPAVGSAVTKGTAARSASLTTDAYGRVTSLTDQLISIDPSTQLSANVPLSKLPQASTNTGSTLVARDASGNFAAGTITASSFSGPLSGNASTATSVDWSGVQNKPGAWMANATLASTITDANTTLPSGFYSGAVNGIGQTGVSNAPTTNAIAMMISRYNNAGVNSGFDLVSDVTADGMWYRYALNNSFGTWRKVVLENSGTYAINVSGAAGSVLWSNVTGRPTALSSFTNDSGYVTPAGSVNYSNSTGAVAWTNVSSRPTAVSQFTNDSGYLTAGGSIANATNWTGSRQLSWAMGDGTNALSAMTNTIPVWRNRLYTSATLSTLTCKVNSGSVTVSVFGNSGAGMGSVICGTGWTAVGLNGNNYIPNGHDISFQITAVSGSPTSVSFEGGYSVSY